MSNNRKIQMMRVSKHHPCPICGKADWCLVASDGSVAICPRIESNRRAGQAGYLHILGDGSDGSDGSDGGDGVKQPLSISILTSSIRDFSTLARQYQIEAENTGKIKLIAKDIDLSSESLHRFGVGWSSRESASIWPLSDATGRIIGLNRRFADGSKRIIYGHKAGLYMPVDLPHNLMENLLLICEGGSDAVAGLDLGFWSIGRFSCTHGAGLLKNLVQHRQPAEVIIVADCDESGQRGAESLALALLAYVPSLKVITPPAKDLRTWKRAGADHEEINQLVKITPLLKLKIRIG